MELDLSSVDAESTATDNYSESRYTDYLTRASSKPQRNSAETKDLEDVTYASVLERFVASLAKEKRNDDILALYASEMKKYPDEQGLYEQMLQWLGQTNLFEEQLKVYKEDGDDKTPAAVFHEAVGYDHRRFTRVVGTIPAGQVETLLFDLREQPAGLVARRFIEHIRDVCRQVEGRV